MPTIATPSLGIPFQHLLLFLIATFQKTAHMPYRYICGNLLFCLEPSKIHTLLSAKLCAAGLPDGAEHNFLLLVKQTSAKAVQPKNGTSHKNSHSLYWGKSLSVIALHSKNQWFFVFQLRNRICVYLLFQKQL